MNELNQPETEVRPSKKNRMVSKFAYVVLAILASAVFVFLYWSFQPADVLTVRNEPVPVRIFTNGESGENIIIMNVDYCKTVKADGRVRFSFVSKTREVFLPVGEDKQPPSCHVRDIPVIIPSDLPADTYRIKFTIIYTINPIKEVTEVFESLEFDIERSDS